MDERPATGTRGGPGGDADAGGETVEVGRPSGRADRLTTVEQWTPPSTENANAAVDRHLLSDESLRLVDDVIHLDGTGRPATVGLTDRRLLLVSEDDGLVSVGLDRICSVRSDVRTTFGLRGADYRLLLAVGYLLAIVGLVGVLATAANPLTPTFALVVLGGVLATDHVLREGADFDPVLAALDRHDGDTGLGERLRDGKRRVNRHAADEDLAFGAASGLAAGTFVLVLAVEGASATPLFAALILAGTGLAVYSFRHSESFDGFELVRRRQRTVTATVDDGSAVTVRTRPDSRLGRDLAGLVEGAEEPVPSEETGD